MKRHLATAILLASALSPALAQSQPMAGMAMKGAPKADLAKALVGAWHITGFFRTEEGSKKVTYPVGEHPIGYMIFTPKHMAVMVTASNRKTPKVPYSVADRAAVMLDIAAAYVGPYTLKGDQLTVHETTTLRPDNVGLDSLRTIKIEGNKLTVINAPAKNSINGAVATATMTAERDE
jgi:hypothetical protein